MLARSLVLSSLLALAGCAESHGACIGTCPDASAVDGGIFLDASSEIDAGPVIEEDGGPSCLPHAATEHRTEVAACDHVRGPGSPPEPGTFPGDCTSDAECTDGENGRCTSWGRGGAGCTYDQCFVDGDCGPGATCECGAGSGANVCKPSNCRTDDDCATGFCSPTFGSCGAYSGNVAYYCHTCEDECVNDADCGGDGSWGAAYCAFEPTVGRWICSDSHCAG